MNSFLIWLIVMIFLILVVKTTSKKDKKGAAPEPRPAPGPAKTRQVQKPITDYVVFDLETTGIKRQSSEIIQIGAIKVVNSVITDRFCTYVRPIGYIPDSATNVNHITYDMVKDAPDLKTALQDFVSFFGSSLLIGYNNGTFDIPLLKRDILAELGLELENDFIDVLRFARMQLRGLENYKLSTVANYLHIPNENAHDALFDSVMTYKCFMVLSQDATPEIKNAKDITTPQNKRPISEGKEIEARRLSMILSECDDFAIEGHTFCLTSDATVEEDEQLSDRITAAGGKVLKRMSKNVDYLVIGKPSERWKYGKYGTKLVTATDLIDAGNDIKIIREEFLLKHLSGVIS